MKNAEGLKSRRVRSGGAASHFNQLLTWNWEQIRFAVRLVYYREKYLKPFIGGVQSLFPATVTKFRLVRPERIALTQYFKNFFLT